MGATKRVAEALVSATRPPRPAGRTSSVRFGNVLGSAGSVVPIFQRQLEHGEPLTVTHPEMTRYFMTIPEAAWLILDAAALGRAGDLFVLDMGEPVQIVDLARDLIRLSGRDPEGGVPIQITGLRPGEKLHEQLFYDAEQIHSTEVPKVLRAVGDGIPYDIHLRAARILEAATGARDAELRIALFDLVESLSTRARHPDPPDPRRRHLPAARRRGARASGDRVGLMTDVAAPFLPVRQALDHRPRASRPSSRSSIRAG